MLNDTFVLKTLLNETTVTQTMSGIVVPIVAILMTGIVAIFSGVITVFVTRMSIKHNEKILFINTYKEKMNEAILKISVKAGRGEIFEINEFIDSEEGVYIPKDLKKKIRKEIRKEINPNFFDKILMKIDELHKHLRKEKYTNSSDRILSILNEYISP
jgi:hypothetical protein